MTSKLNVGFAARHARQVQAMLDEVNSRPAARIAVSGTGARAADLVTALASDTQDVVVLIGEDATAASLDEFEALVYVGSDWPIGARAVETLRAADRASLPIVAVIHGVKGVARRDEIPYVLATDVIVADGSSAAALAVVERLAARAKGDAYTIARALPHFREPVSKAIIRHYARLNALVGALSLVPGADLPVLTLNQLRMVVRLAGAYDVELDAKRLVELGAVVGASVGLRGVARSALSILPGPRWSIKGGVAFGGTTAIGEAAAKRFRAQAGAAGPDC